MLDKNSKLVIEHIYNQPNLSSKDIFDSLGIDVSYATLKRILAKLKAKNLISSMGKGRGTTYKISVTYELFYPLNIDTYFKKEQDERQVKEHFNFSLITEVFTNVDLFTKEELQHLKKLQEEYTSNISQLSHSQYSRELERLAIDLSWKSSQIEGNTYSLLETERLLKEQETAEGKAKDDATMLLNHKAALDFIFTEPDYVTPLTLARIEDIHSILIRDLGVDRNIRKRRVGILGTNYKPLDNEFQIKEALGDMCNLVNSKQNFFEQALLLLVLISYIQAFNDGNKRTARIISNAVLISHNYCPISFRTVNSIDYKKAMLLFYEQNNITAFKDIFINQFEFAVKTYF